MDISWKLYDIKTLPDILIFSNGLFLYKHTSIDQYWTVIYDNISLYLPNKYPSSNMFI